MCRNKRKPDQILRMEEVPGGLSGGGCNSNEEDCGATTRSCGSSLTTPLKVGAMRCTKVAPNIEFGRLTSFLQHECDDGMFIDPHCCAMCLQQSRSASVISAPGMRQAIAGIPDTTTRSRTLANWRTGFTSQIVYAQFGTRANSQGVRETVSCSVTLKQIFKSQNQIALPECRPFSGNATTASRAMFPICAPNRDDVRGNPCK